MRPGGLWIARAWCRSTHCLRTCASSGVPEIRSDGTAYDQCSTTCATEGDSGPLGQDLNLQPLVSFEVGVVCAPGTTCMLLRSESAFRGEFTERSTRGAVRTRSCTKLAVELFFRVCGGFRTRYLLDHNEALYQMSYVHHVRLSEIKFGYGFTRSTN